MARANTDTARRLGLLIVAAGLAAGIALVGRRRAQGRSTPHEETYTCACGAEYRVTGADRHRVYWREQEAVLGDQCVACDAPLPTGHDATVV